MNHVPFNDLQSCVHMICPHLFFLSIFGPLYPLYSDEVFGTGVDPNNLKSALRECSWDQAIVTLPSAGTNQMAAEGVIEVSIGISLTDNSRGIIRNAVTTAVQNKLGYSLPGPYDYVLYALEKCYEDCGWAAYAYVNSWNSVYQSGYYKQPGVLVHEVSKWSFVFNISHNICWPFRYVPKILPVALSLHLHVLLDRSQLRPCTFRRYGRANLHRSYLRHGEPTL